MNDKTSFRDLIKDLSAKTDRSQDSTQDFMKGLVDVIEAGLRTSGSVTISGFGKFELRWIEERKGINPQTQEEITIPGQNKVVFIPYKVLKEHVNRPYARMEAQILDDAPDKTGEKKPVIPVPAEQKEKSESERLAEDIEPVELDAPNKELFKKESDPSEIDKSKAQAHFPFFIEEDDAEDDPEEELIAIKPSPVARQQSSKEEKISGSKLEKEPRKKNSFRWSYAAAGALAALLFIAVIFFMLPDEREPSDIAMIEPPALQTPPPVPDEDETGRIDSEETNLITIIIDSGQSLWELALEYLGDPYLWPWIFGVNSDIITNPNVITSGSTLNIPDPQDEILSDNDLQEVAYGYISVYYWYTEQDSEEARNYLWAAGSFYPPVLDEMENNVNADDLRYARSR